MKSPSPAFRLDGAHVVVTGASSGLGRALARRAAHLGARVSVVARRKALLEDLAAEIGGTAVPADLADPAELAGLLPLLEQSGPIDALINNAALPPTTLLLESDPGALRATIAVNLVAPIALCRAVLPGMAARRRGRIVNIASLAGIVAVPGMNVYAGTKAGLTQFTRCLQRELRGTPARATVVQLGEVAGTDIWNGAVQCSSMAQALRDRLQRLHASPTSTPEEAAVPILEALVAGRSSACVPRVIAPLSALRELPTRFVDLVATGIY